MLVLGNDLFTIVLEFWTRPIFDFSPISTGGYD